LKYNNLTIRSGWKEIKSQADTVAEKIWQTHSIDSEGIKFGARQIDEEGISLAR